MASRFVVTGESPDGRALAAAMKRMLRISSCNLCGGTIGDTDHLDVTVRPIPDGNGFRVVKCNGVAEL